MTIQLGFRPLAHPHHLHPVQAQGLEVNRVGAALEEGEEELPIDGEEHRLPEVGAEEDGGLHVPAGPRVRAGDHVYPRVVAREVERGRAPRQVEAVPVHGRRHVVVAGGVGRVRVRARVPASHCDDWQQQGGVTLTWKLECWVLQQELGSRFYPPG